MSHLRENQVNNRKHKGAKGGRPPKLDANRYKDRNVVERFFSRVKQWRGLATRFDKHAINYRSGMVLFAVFDWLKPNLGTRPEVPQVLFD